jgi:putative restriction endonuclease
MTRVFGNISGIPEETPFESRAALASSGVHRPSQAGISGSEKEGADSIVVSGGYEDDEDYGDVIIYTGHGGQDPNTKKQVADQEFKKGNKALATNKSLGLPVRVVRGSNSRSQHAPLRGYRYDGLFRVDEYWRDKGRSGFAIWRYRLVKEKDPVLSAPLGFPSGNEQPVRRESTVVRVIRSTDVGTSIKALYKHVCQVCGTVLITPSGPYAEAAHIKPLGTPHNGPDTPDNVLCLCPNHHVLFDCGAFSIASDYSLRGLTGRLKVDSKHFLNQASLAYHNAHFFQASAAKKRRR